MGTETRKTAREYLRVSKDRSGKAKSTTEQTAENAQHAEREGYELGAPYSDVGRSASRYAKREREDFGRLIADLENGTFGADVLVLWESSRGSRRLSEWARLLELLRERGITVYVTTYSRELDPREPRDMRTLQEDGVDSEYESAKTAKRTQRSRLAAATEGRPHGKVPLGYKRIYHPTTRELVAQIPDDDPHAEVTEPYAPWIRELFARLRAGHTLRAIAEDFAARGLRTPTTGKPYSATHLRALAVKGHTYAGLRTHTRDGKMTLSEGIWEPLVDRETFHAVVGRLSAPERRTSRPGSGVHLLSMIAVCDVCAGPMTVKTNHGKHVYQCAGNGPGTTAGHVIIDKADLDDFGQRAILEYLTSEKIAATLAERENRAADVQAVRDKIAELESEMDALADDLTIPARALSRRTTLLEAALEELRTEEREISTPSALRGLITPGPDAADQWGRMDMAAKRQTARIVLSPDYLGTLRITRAPWIGNAYRAKATADDRHRFDQGEDMAQSA